PSETVRTDPLGHPLPKGAVARMGTVRFNSGNMVKALAFSPDGTRLATWTLDWLGSGRDMLIYSDVATGRELNATVLQPCHLLALRWLPDGRGLAVVKLNTSEYFVWEFTDPKAALPVIANPTLNSTMPRDVYGVAISPDGRWLATGRVSFDGGPQPIELRDLTPNTRLAELKPRELGRQAGH